MKKLPVEVDMPEWLIERAAKSESEKLKAIGDHALVGYYYLLRIGEYTIRHGQSQAKQTDKQTEQFKMKDVAFFCVNSQGRMYQCTKNARAFDIMRAKSATLKLDNQKNGWKGVCVNHEHNGESVYCAVRALGRRYLHIRQHAQGDWKCLLSAYFVNDKRHDVTDKDIREGVKAAATALDYLGTRGIPVDRVDTHSLRIGGACALALAGYSDTQIQKMGRWKGATFKEYVREELSNYSEGMSKAMAKKHCFVNVAAGVLQDVTESVMMMDFNSQHSSAA